MIKLYCEQCEKFQPVIIKIENHRTGIWGDILCKKCKLSIATIKAEEPGEYEIIKKEV